MKTISIIKYTFLLAIMAFSFNMNAQTSASSEYEAENEGWLVKIDEAYEQSQKTGKPILANFTGSDWCGWCKRLTKSVFVKKEFKQWAEKNVILLELDFPKRKRLPADLAKQNRSLQQSFKVRGYPTIWLFDLAKNDTGEFEISALGKTGYKKTPQEFTADLDKMLEQR